MEILQSFKSNLNRLALINNNIVFRTEDNTTIRFKTPTLEDSINELDFDTFIAILGVEIKDIKSKQSLLFKVENNEELRLALSIKSEYSDIMQHFLYKYIENFRHDDYRLYVGEHALNSKEFDFIVQVIMISLNRNELPDFDEAKKLEEERAKMSEAQRKLQDRKKEVEKKLQKAKESKSQKATNNLTLEQIILALQVEFTFSLETILSMNFHTFTWYYSFIGVIDMHHVHRVAAGNGLMKNYKYFLK